jgi:hypothetical protein
MVPATFTFIDALPLTVNGKLDAKALPEPDRAGSTVAPVAFTEATPLQHNIQTVWRDVLHIPEPGLDQNFFDVGGNSLHIAEVHARLQTVLDRQFSITELFAHSTIRALATHFAAGPQARGPGEAQLRAERQRSALLARRNLRHDGK